jgi:hypothetical protein
MNAVLQPAHGASNLNCELYTGWAGPILRALEGRPATNGNMRLVRLLENFVREALFTLATVLFGSRTQLYYQIFIGSTPFFAYL